MKVVGIDVGGTFTDTFVLDESTGELTVGKVRTTRTREAEGFLTGITEAAGQLDDVSTIIHGTTVGTNALLERKGARTGVITTSGFADSLEMRRRDRPNTWGLRGTFRPVAERDVRIGVPERTLASGAIHTELDRDAVTDAVARLQAAGCDAVAISFLHSYANAANEIAAGELVRSLWHNDAVTVGSELLAEIREFERTSTAVLNASLQPVVGGYLERLETTLDEHGFDGQFFVVASNGGVMSVPVARSTPVRTALSGPAAGVIAAAHLADAAGFGNIICGDMGGTSFDVSLVVDGRSQLADQTSIDFGLVVRSPMIEISTIGAGGGSIAWVDAGGLLRIGPESAGGEPGPACYGMGNDRPTVTDANLVLGRINGDRPIGSLDGLDVDAARRAVDTHVGEPLGLSTENAAEAIIAVATAMMCGALRLVSIERGHDPTNFWTMPFGGAGALHCCRFIDELGLAGAIIPRHPGVVSALGCVMADMRHDAVQTINQPLGAVDPAALSAHVSSAETHGRQLLDDAEMAFTGVSVEVELDMSYVGQTHTIAVAIPYAGEQSFTPAQLLAAFNAAYLDTYGRLLDGVAVRVLTLRTTVIGHRPEFDAAVFAPPAADDAASPVATRTVVFESEAIDTPIHDRLALAEGTTIDGPAVLEQPDATTLIEPGFVATVDRLGNVLVTRP